MLSLFCKNLICNLDKFKLMRLTIIESDYLNPQSFNNVKDKIMEPKNIITKTSKFLYKTLKINMLI
jgi:hypothetical protein